jgi:3-oxoacyl-[acyl-carrier-protein] synthase II
MARRVVVTGLGTVNPLGNTVEEFWKNTRAGQSGIARISRFDPEPFPCRIAGEVKGFDPHQYMEARDARRMDNFALYLLAASVQAMDDAGLKNGDLDPERLGVVIGCGIGGIETLEAQIVKHHEQRYNVKSIHPLFVPKMISNIGAGQVSIRMNAQGPCYVVVTACSSSTDAIGNAMMWIERGVTDVMICGGTEAPLAPAALGGFSALQTLSTHFNDAPEKASRPFDKDRDGFVMGEGAGIIVIEDLEHALRRNARIHAELAGYGVSSDASHLTAPHPEGRGAQSAMRMALAHAGLAPEDVDYVNAHGTSTQANDPVESRAIEAVFGAHAHALKVSSTKSMTGHLLGAAGGVEAVVTVMAIREQFFPPTINHDEPDPACRLDYVANRGVSGRIRAAISNSLGFGGHNAVVCFKRWEG